MRPQRKIVGVNFLLKYRLSLFWVLLILISGCQQKDLVERLRRENPFTDSPEPDPATILVVTSHCLLLELPSHIDVTALPFWSEHSLPSDRLASTEAIKSGFTAEQLRIWRENGLSLSLAPTSDWKTFVDGLDQAGATHPFGSEKTAIFQYPRQFYVISTNWIEQSQSVFVTDSTNGFLRGDTLMSGDCFFRLSCMPSEGKEPTDSTYIEITPVWQSATPELKLDENQPGFNRYNPQIVFDRVTISGILQNGYFLAVTSMTDAGKNESLGQLFLNHLAGGENYQFVLLIAPQVQTATEIKAKK